MPRSLLVPVVLCTLALVFSACDAFNGDDPGDPPNPDPKPREVADSLYVTTDSGLMYHDFFVGEGDMADSTSVVQVHYHGWLIDGQLFDSSVFRGVPLVFALGRGSVITGFEEGIRGMRVGGERQLVIPPDLGYGTGGTSVIPPNATLIFEVVLLQVQ